MRNKKGMFIAFALLISVILIFSGCAKAPKAPETVAKAPTVNTISSEVSSGMATASEIVDEELKEVNFTLVDENLI